MKKRLAKLALLLSMVVTTSCFAAAESNSTPKPEPERIPLVVKFQLVQIDDGQAQKLRGLRTTNSNIRGTVLNEMEMLTSTDLESLVMIGDKWPIIYFDPRAQQFQVQYVDVGAKLDVKVKLAAQGNFDLEIRPETSNVLEVKNEGELRTYPQTNVLICETRYQSLKPGETLLFGHFRSGTATRFLQREGLPTTPSNLIYTLKVERP